MNGENPFEKLPITVCTLCKNEASNLPRCLGEISAFAEWIVFDTGSSDNSMEIARSFGATVVNSRWEGFTKSRRTHFNLATQNWILWIDADEDITAEFVAELRALFSLIPQHAAYQINRLMNFQGQWVRHGEWFPDRVTRLFHKDFWEMPDREIHEAVTINGSVGRLKTLVPHHSYRDWADRSRRIENYTELWARQRNDCPSAPSPFLRGSWRFFRSFVLKAGFLDGSLGFRIATSIGWETYMKYRKLRLKNGHTPVYGKQISHPY